MLCKNQVNCPCYPTWGTFFGASEANGSRASKVTIQGEIVVPGKDKRSKDKILHQSVKWQLIMHKHNLQNPEYILLRNFDFLWKSPKWSVALGYLTKTFAKKRTKRHIFPCLNISCCWQQLIISMISKIKLMMFQIDNLDELKYKRDFVHTTPVIHQNKSKDMICSLVNIHRFPQLISRANYSSLETILKWDKFHKE